MNSLRWVGYLGIAAAIVFIAATGLGSVLDPDYSQINQHVSDLTGASAPTRLALGPLYIVYNLLLFGFALAFYRSSDRSSLSKAGLGLLTLNALSGVLMIIPFREDLPGTTQTALGTGHIIWAGVASLVIVAGSFVFGVAFRRLAGWRPLSIFSFAVGVAYLIVGPLAVVATTRNSLDGLAERGAIGLFILWVLVVSGRALVLARSAGRAASGVRPVSQ